MTRRHLRVGEVYLMYRGNRVVRNGVMIDRVQEPVRLIAMNTMLVVAYVSTGRLVLMRTARSLSRHWNGCVLQNCDCAEVLEKLK